MVESWIGAKNHNEAEEIMEFIKTLNANEEKEFIFFLQGIKFAKAFMPEKKKVP